MGYYLRVTPPKAKRVPKRSIEHGVTRVDYYAWLREREDPEVRAYLESENAYTEEVMRETLSLQQELYEEMKARTPEEDVSAPYVEGGYYYYSRMAKDAQYGMLCRKRGSLASPEEVLLDENALARGSAFFSLGFADVSPNQQLLAYGVDTDGSEAYTLYIKDLKTGELLPDTLTNLDTSFEWANDSRTWYVVAQDLQRRAYQVLRSVLGESERVVVYEEKDERFAVALSKSRSKKFIFITAASPITKEVHTLDADIPRALPRVVSARIHNHEYVVDHRGGFFYIVSNHEAPNFKLMRTPLDRPNMINWEEVLAERPDTTLEGFDMFEGFIVLFELHNALQQLRIYASERHLDYYVSLPESAYDLGGAANPSFVTDAYRFSYSSPITPPTVYECAVPTGSLTVLKEFAVHGGYDRTRYVVERAQVSAADGECVPLTLVYKKGARDGRNPALLYGYGAYGVSLFPDFSYEQISLLDRGFVLATAHVRGGGERGESWYEAGKFLQKKNTFTDFIACAEYLTKERYCHRDKLVMSGRSAGGLLVGAVLNMRRDLFHTVVTEVPFVDVMNTMLDPTLPLTVGEYEEWGNPADRAYYDYMLSYSPYDNVQQGAYPHLLVLSGFNDARVQYWESAKWVAKLRASKTDTTMLLLKTDLQAGHGGASGRYNALKDEAFEMAFVLRSLA